MYKHMLKLFSTPCRNVTLTRFNSTTVSPKEKWDLLTAVCVERKPIIAPPLNEIEKNFKSLLEEIEFEQSSKSDHEVRHETDLKQTEFTKKGRSDLDPDVQVKQTAQDFVDLCTEELSKFHPGNKVIDAEEKNLKSLKRKLDRHLVLVINQKVGSKSYYILPHAPREDGETLRQTAERVLKQECGTDLECQIYGNGPSSFYKYKYPTSVRKQSGSVGAKIFIYFARYLDGRIAGDKIDYKWLDRSELQNSLPKYYKTSVLDMLIDE